MKNLATILLISLSPVLLFSQSDLVTSNGSSYISISRDGVQRWLKAGANQTLPFSNGTTISYRPIAAGDLPSLGSLYLPISGGTLTGNLLFTDNTFDIGASGATRPRTGYFGTSVISPIFNAATGFQVAGAANSGNYLRGNGANFVSSAIQAGDIPDISATYLKHGVNTLTVNTSFDGAFAWRMGQTTALTDFRVATTDSTELLVGTNGVKISTGFTRFLANGLVYLQANHTTGVVNMVVPDNTANAFTLAISGGNNIVSATTTDGAEVSNFGTASVGGRTNLVSEVTNIAGSIGITDRTITATATIVNGDHYVYLDATTGAQTITLPTPTYKMILEFKRIDNNPATVITFTGTVDGVTNPTSTGGGSPIATLATQYGAIKLVWNGTNWYAF
jgi:hypothetical protein